MSQSAIEVRDVGKRYRLGERARYLTLRESLASALRGKRSRGDRSHELWALKDVSLTVQEGEVVGVVGRNGAGKTTLLRILARITEPTTGVARTRGRVGSLLEVGTGFHPELTGRENVILFGTVLGIPRKDVLSAMEGIADFAEIDSEHMATPVKRFSEGMMSRLAFATALRFPADVYIFDEVLVTADDHFKSKCTTEIELLRDNGAAVFFISHELSLVRAICSRGMWLEDGRVRAIGPIDDLARDYEALDGGPPI